MMAGFFNYRSAPVKNTQIESNPFQGCLAIGTYSQGRRCRANPGALGLNPFGILRAD